MSVLAGNVVHAWIKIKDGNGDYINPTTLRVKVRNPSLVDTTYVYGVDAELVKESTGKYYIDIDTTGSTGTWYIKWTSTGTGKGVAETNFTVVATEI